MVLVMEMGPEYVVWVLPLEQANCPNHHSLVLRLYYLLSLSQKVDRR